MRQPQPPPPPAARGHGDSPRQPPHSVVLAEDDVPTRLRLAEVLAGHPAFELRAAVGTCAEGREALERERPDVLITDLGLPDGEGIELIQLAGQLGAGTQCMAITVFGDERHVLAAIEAGALGYLLKDGTPETITNAVLEMLAGGSPISAPIARHVLRRLRAPDDPRPEAPSAAAAQEIPPLSPREHEVLQHVVKGFSFPEIADLLGVSPHTVTTHVRGIYRKLAVSSRGEAVYEALQLGLVRLED